MNNGDIRSLSDKELWNSAERLAGDSRAATCDLIETLAELDRRRLPEKSVYASLHAYCVRKLLMSDSAAYRHIRAARALRAFPPVGPALRDGRLSLETIVMLHPHLKDQDADSLVASALGKSVDEVERLLAPRRTSEPRKDVVRLIAAAVSPDAAPAPSSGAASAPSEPASPALPAIPESLPGTGGRRFESRAELYASIPDREPPPPPRPPRRAHRLHRRRVLRPAAARGPGRAAAQIPGRPARRDIPRRAAGLTEEKPALGFLPIAKARLKSARSGRILTT